jgi:hypothetical protein
VADTQSRGENERDVSLPKAKRNDARDFPLTRPGLKVGWSLRVSLSDIDELVSLNLRITVKIMAGRDIKT